MKKRVFSFILSLVMVLVLWPSNIVWAKTVSFDQNSGRNATITVRDTDGNPVTGATIKVTKQNDTFTVQEFGNGQYKFTRDTLTFSKTFSITVSKDGYETATASMQANNASISITLEKEEPVVVVEMQEFRLYYIANGNLPSKGYAAGGDALDYGPSADNTPFAILNIDVAMLRQIASLTNSPVVYKENTQDNQYEFSPVGTVNDANALANVKAFWNAVLTCVDEDSITALEETGLADYFMAYSVKKQNDSSCHMDGVLAVSPPVYVVELYENDAYFGGAVTDIESHFPTMYDLLDQYEAHLKQTITWEEDANGKPLRKTGAQYDYYTGTYIDTETNKIHTITVYQYPDANSVYVENENGPSEIPYAKRTETYYYTRFNMSIDAGRVVNYLVTYTDGLPGENLFSEHEYAASYGETVPAFTGVTIRDGYTFMGWTREGDVGGTVYSDADIAAMQVTKDMVFHAVWHAVPKFTGTVKVVLNGVYDSTTGKVVSGTPVDIATMFGDAMQLYVSADGETYLPLTHVQTGWYNSVLENGVYRIYYSKNGTEYTLVSEQSLIIENADRTRYLFYNSVTYDAAGGTINGAATQAEYYYGGSAVNVLANAPVRSGYLFKGWEDQNGNVYAPSALLTGAIGEAYTLTARWVKATNVYVHVTIDHLADDGQENNDASKHDVSFTVDMRPVGSNGNFTEIYSKDIEWDGESLFTDAVYAASVSQDGRYTYYTAKLPTIANVSTQYEYTVTKTKTGYSLISVTSRYDENGDLQVYATLQYDPENVNFEWTVELDDEAKDLPTALWPKAVNVKVVYWDSELLDWVPIAPQEFTYERIELNAEGVGTGRFSVHAATTDDVPVPYYYRVIVVSYELQDGTVSEAIKTGLAEYECQYKRYTTTVEVNGGASPHIATTLRGAHYENNVWDGSVKAIVSIPVFTVTFLPNGGTLGGNQGATVLEKQIIGPDLSLYVPTRGNGYVFEGWYVYENGNMTEIPAVSFADLTADLTLIAKWRAAVSVGGMITVGATYALNGEFYQVHDSDRADYVQVLLQKKLPSGYYETVQEKIVLIAYDNEDYYFQGRLVGYGEYLFEGLPDDGAEYRITVLSANYTSTYQDEPESVTEEKWAYNTYDVYSYFAVFGEVEPSVATINAHLHFEPTEFDLQYEVNASQIGQGFRPDEAEVLVTYQTDDKATLAPNDWSVISQLIFAGEYRPLQVVLGGAGIGGGSYPVWQVSHDGTNKYDYGLLLYSTVNGQTITPFEANPYFTVSYQAPAHYNLVEGAQSQLLIATLIPKTYSVRYEANGGYLFGTQTTTHTWSYATNLLDVTPMRDGYLFGGWYWDEGFTQPLIGNTIGANVANDVVLYAKWTKISVKFQAVINHKTENGTVKDFDKLLNLQLVSRPVDTTEAYTPVEDHSREYESSYWHTPGETIDGFFEYFHTSLELSNQMDYSVEASIDGYRVVDSYTHVDDEQSVTYTTGTTKEEFHSNDVVLIQYTVLVCLEPNVSKLVFHSNNQATLEGDVFRTYCAAEMIPAEGAYSLNQDGTVAPFYEIPTYDYNTHNLYIFKGWYTAAGKPMDWNTTYNLVGTAEDVHLYANWLTVGTVESEEADGKNMEYAAHPGAYPGFDLLGVQIRESSTDNGNHHGTAGSGLRFVAVLSNTVYEELTALSNADMEYGFAVAKTSAAQRYAGDTVGYTLQCNGTNVNGVDTTVDYKYVKNMICSGVQDHYASDSYRLYTAVITYGNKTGDDLAEAQAVEFVARPYLCYTDANGLTRTHYNNYTGTPTYGGCSTSFTAVHELVTAMMGGDVQ